MNIINTIVIVIAIWYVAKLFLDSTPAKKIEKSEKFAETMLSSYRTTNKVSYGRENDEPEVLRMKDWYIRLKEKYKHDTSRLVQIAEDWKDYAYNLSSKNISHYLWLESGDVEGGKAQYDEARESHLKIEEIENRFADGLGSEFRRELETDRKKKSEAAEAFWSPKEETK